MDLLILRKKIDGFRSGNGQLQNVPPELLFELRQAWENFTGPAEEFRRELGMKVGTLRKLLVDSKKLNHVLASAEAVGLTESGGHSAPEAASDVNTDKPLELAYDGGSKVIRFPSLDLLIEFLRKSA
jgi:hypothetical protein